MIDRTLFFIYHTLWTLVGVPLLFLARWKKETSLHERLWTEFPSYGVCKNSIWVHALSVGEVLSALPLVQGIRESCPQRPLVFTASTSQGMEVARKELGGKVDCLFRMPLDFWWSMRRVIGFIDPTLMIVVETDLWPGYLRLLKQRGARILLVNGRISPRTLSSYKKFRFLVRRMLFSTIDRCLVQSDMDRQRLLEIGVDADKVKESGNIKFDREWKTVNREETGILATTLGLAEERVWVAGSTHPGEDATVLDVYMRLRPSFTNLRLIIAPRRIEEGAAVRDLASSKGLKAVLRTHLTPGATASFDVLVIDTLGELGRIYALAKVVFVGGSLIPEGGHNLLEPASLGCPVLFGPHMNDFLAMSELLLEAGGGMRVENGEALYKAVEGLLSKAAQAEAMGKKAREFVERNRGALGRVMEEIRIALSGR